MFVGLEVVARRGFEIVDSYLVAVSTKLLAEAVGKRDWYSWTRHSWKTVEDRPLWAAAVVVAAVAVAADATFLRQHASILVQG